MNQLIENIHNTCSEVKVIYEELRRIQTPEHDQCVELLGFITQKAGRQIKGLTTDDEEEPWPDVGSILDSTG